MRPMNRHLTILYLLLLAITIGAALAAGAFSAPVIFNANTILGSEHLSRLQSGQIMTEIFIRTNSLLGFSAMAILAFEGIAATRQRHFLPLYPTTIALLGIFGFLFAFTPYMVHAQKQGEAALKSPHFEKMHVLSEITFKMILISLVVLFVYRLYKLSSEYGEE